MFYSISGVDYPVNSSELKVIVSSFRSNTIKLKVTKKPDKIGVDLLGEDTEEQQGLWGSITRYLCNNLLFVRSTLLLRNVFINVLHLVFN